MILIANRQLVGSYGTARPGDRINVTDDDAVKELLRSGVASIPPPPRIFYETKVVTAPPEGAGNTFRHLYMPNDKPEVEVAPSGDPVVQVANVSTEAAPASPRRRGRPRKVQR